MRNVVKWVGITIIFFLLLWTMITMEGCSTLEGMREDIHQVTRPAD